jgi:leucyl-tRNA synthetase
MDGLISEGVWPVADRELIRDDSVTLPVQVNGKRRAEVTVPRGADAKAVEAAALALEAVQRAMDGKPAKKVIVVAERIVNVVV